MAYDSRSLKAEKNEKTAKAVRRIREGKKVLVEGKLKFRQLLKRQADVISTHATISTSKRSVYIKWLYSSGSKANVAIKGEVGRKLKHIFFFYN